MTIGIIGSGNVGKIIAEKATVAGYKVVMSNSRGVQSLIVRHTFCTARGIRQI